MDHNIKTGIRTLWEKAQTAYVGSVDEEGFPQIKAMFVPKQGNIKIQYFSTNTSSKRAAQFLKNPKASVYYCDEDNVKGALFTGTMEVCTDHETKALIWSDGDEQYYPNGVDDEDYCVFKFTAETVKYWPDSQKRRFPIDDLL